MVCFKCYFCERVQGVKGPSVLALHSPFDVVWGVVIDDLQGVFLGVTLTLLYLWLSKAYKRKLFFIYKEVHVYVNAFTAIRKWSSTCMLYLHWFSSVMSDS